MTAYEISSSSSCVEFWSETRLPLSPNGALLAARDKLRAALRLMLPEHDQRLLAQLISTSNGFFDVENVLIYNVGTGTFAQATRNGVRVVRLKCSSPPAPSGRNYPHFHRYIFEKKGISRTGTPSLSFRLPNINSGSKPHDVWWFAREAKAEGCGASISGEFRLDVLVPLATGSNLAGIVKPLLDALICSMHSPGEVCEAVVNRLSSKIGCDAKDVSSLLRSPVLPVLPGRVVVGLYRDFVKWDPADELCTEFVVEPCSIESQCQVWISERDSG